MADGKARASATRMARRLSHQSTGPIVAPSNLKLVDPFEQHPGKSDGPNDLGGSARGNDLGLLASPMCLNLSTRDARKQRRLGERLP